MKLSGLDVVPSSSSPDSGTERQGGGQDVQLFLLRDGDPDRKLSPGRRYGPLWPSISAKFLSEHPACVRCGGPAVHAHHRRPVSRGGDHRWSNLLACCNACHGRIHAEDDPEWLVDPDPRIQGLRVFST